MVTMSSRLSGLYCPLISAGTCFAGFLIVFLQNQCS